MPLYEYRCESCEHLFERIQKFSDPPVDVCPACGAGPVVKLLSSPAIQFKGTGWYITDYARKGQGGTPASTSAGAAKSDGSGGDAGGSKSSDAPATSSSTPASTPSKE